MKILDHNELPEKFDAQNQLLQMSAGWGIYDFEQQKRDRDKGYPATNYWAVYAVEGDELLSKVEAIHVEYKTPNGLETVCGINGVLTRPEKARKGLARTLLEEVHRRERDAGVKYMLLWTGGSIKAHVLYLSLGYVDIYAVPVAVKKIELSAESTNSVKMRPASTDDAALLEQLHSEITRNRIGFTRRYRNFWQMRFAIGYDKPENYQILLEDDKPVAYLRLKEEVNFSDCYEMAVEDARAESALDALEARMAGRWLALGNTFVLDSRASLQRRGYEFSSSYHVLMAMSLDGKSESELKHELGASDRKFVCHSGDHF